MEQPLVIDFELRPDGFWIIVQNIASTPLLSFSADFAVPIYGRIIPGAPNNARVVVSNYPLFKICQYMAPGKRFEFFVENDVTFFKINPTLFTINVNTMNSTGINSHYAITHNLDIYKQMLQTPSLISKKA